MAFIAPTAADIRAAFPEFADVGDGPINAALAEAALAVDTTWSEASFQIARMLYAAHVMVLDGLGSSATAEVFLDSPNGLKMRKAGDTVEEFFGPATASSASEAWFGQTNFGRRFYRIMRKQFAGPRVY